MASAATLSAEHAEETVAPVGPAARFVYMMSVAAVDETFSS